MAFVGKFLYDKSEGFEEFMSKVAGKTDVDAVKHVASSKPIIEVTFSGDKYTITVTNGDKSIVNTFELGKEFEETMPHGAVIKSVVTKDGDKFTFVSPVPDGNVFTRVYEFTPEGITVHLSDKKSGGKATRWYKRI